MSGQDERPYQSDGRRTGRNNDIVGYMLAILVVVLIVGGTGLYFLSLPPAAGGGYTAPEVEAMGITSYVIATGEFDSIDVYTYTEYTGDFAYKLHAHISESGKKYEVNQPKIDGNDHIDYARIARVSLWILVNGNFTEYRFRLAYEELYNIDIGEIHFEFFLMR